MLLRRSPIKRKNTEDSLEKKKKKPKDLVGNKKGKQKVPQVKKKNQSSGKSKRDMVTLEKDDGGLSSIPTKRMRRTSKLNLEGETETPSPSPHSTAALTDHETDRPETETPPLR